MGQHMEDNLKKYVIALAALAALATTADAACTKKALNGTWLFGLGGQGVTGTMSGGTLSVVFSGSPIVFTVSSYNKDTCKGSGTLTISGTPVPNTKFVTEQISSGSSRKPNHLIITSEVAAGAFYQFILNRR